MASCRRSKDTPSSAGDKVIVSLRGRDDQGNYLLSTVKVEVPKDWTALEAAFASKATIAGTVLELVKGGLRVDVGVPAFMPASRSGARAKWRTSRNSSGSPSNAHHQAR
jgi:small subunit ribosomal protein S1